MKILVVAGSNPIYKFGNPIFLDLAIQIKKLLLEEHTTSIAVDIWDEKVRHFTNKRKKNRNFLTFLSQYLIKLYEIAFLQQKYTPPQQWPIHESLRGTTNSSKLA